MCLQQSEKNCCEGKRRVGQTSTYDQTRLLTSIGPSLLNFVCVAGKTGTYSQSSFSTSFAIRGNKLANHDNLWTTVDLELPIELEP